MKKELIQKGEVAALMENSRIKFHISSLKHCYRNLQQTDNKT